MLFIPDFKMSVPRELHPGSPRASVHCRTGRRQHRHQQNGGRYKNLFHVHYRLLTLV
jgi:hypothetical protein